MIDNTHTKYTSIKTIGLSLLIAFCFCISSLSAQKSAIVLSQPNLDTLDKEELLSLPTTPKKQHFFKKLFTYDNAPNPKRAAIYSLVLPGLGQVYNKQYLKVPVIYGLYTAAVLNIRQHRRLEKRYKSYLVAILDDDPLTVNPTAYDQTTLKRFWNKSRSDKETGYLLLGLLHAIQSADAFVFAHLKGFDVSDDLSMKVQPSVRLDAWNMPYSGISFSLNSKAKNSKSIQPSF